MINFFTHLIIVVLVISFASPVEAIFVVGYKRPNGSKISQKEHDFQIDSSFIIWKDIKSAFKSTNPFDYDTKRFILDIGFSESQIRGYPISTLKKIREIVMSTKPKIDELNSLKSNYTEQIKKGNLSNCLASFQNIIAEILSNSFLKLKRVLGESDDNSIHCMTIKNELAKYDSEITVLRDMLRSQINGIMSDSEKIPEKYLVDSFHILFPGYYQEIEKSCYCSWAK